MLKRHAFAKVGLAVILASAGSLSPAQEQSPPGEAASPGSPAPAAELPEPNLTPLVTSPSGGQRAFQPDCSGLPEHQQLTSALREVVAPGDRSANGGLGNHMWATVVNREGIVCVVTHSGENFGDQWPGSRAIATKKSYAANAFSLSGFALSTANLYWPAQPGNSLYALESSNPVASEPLYAGSAQSWGTEEDSLVGQRIGGVTVFGGGLALYDQQGGLVGGLGLSGDESCTDHVIAWKTRHSLNLDNVPDGVTKNHNDNIIFDLTIDPASGRQKSASGYGHPTCSPAAKTIAENFERTHPTGPQQ